jgi:DNA-binding NarL/FixJ family response regulator
MKVLIVDDSAIMRERLIKLLSTVKGIEKIEEAKNVSEAVNSVREHNPDVVILDIKLSRESGIDLLRDIKKNTPVPVVIILTSYPYPQYRKKCLELGADFFFDKSSDINRLIEVLKKLVKDY